MIERLSAQLTSGSPSETETLSTTAPATKHVKFGFETLTSLSEPELALQRKPSAAGPASESWALADREMLVPTNTSAGFALTASNEGQTFTTPLTSALPVRGPSWHVKATGTAVVWCATTLNTALDEQLVLPSTELAESVME